MRIPLRPFFAIAAAMAWLLLPSCRKERLLLQEDPDAIGQFCRIDTFNFGPAPTYAQQVMITYNHAGNPVTMKASVPGYGELFDDLYFRYDKSGRLVDWIYVYPDTEPYTVFPLGTIDLWHRFSYPGQRTVVDSFFNYDGPGIPPIANPPAGYVVLTVSRYDLDDKGRTIKTYVQYIAGVASFSDTFYTHYDDRGNVVTPGITYDHKINPYRTNKIWQLIYQDYNMNNPIYPATLYHPATTGITAFNKFGLPVSYEYNEADQFPSLFLYQFAYLEIGYSCDQSPGKSMGE
jgi:hypothetical protein